MGSKKSYVATTCEKLRFPGRRECLGKGFASSQLCIAFKRSRQLNQCRPGLLVCTGSGKRFQHEMRVANPSLVSPHYRYERSRRCSRFELSHQGTWQEGVNDCTASPEETRFEEGEFSCEAISGGGSTRDHFLPQLLTRRQKHEESCGQWGASDEESLRENRFRSRRSRMFPVDRNTDLNYSLGFVRHGKYGFPKAKLGFRSRRWCLFIISLARVEGLSSSSFLLGQLRPMVDRWFCDMGESEL